ncbi:MAG TPA: lipoyl domain-containing protein [Solirubrobacterales bacterium]|jgi:pyruvate/2-oxoglutarate dehydrogenase complex dihydrolipoamide acyltransferase (E2) component
MEVTVPKFGVTMQEATLTEWHVAEGDSVEEGQPLADIETDKVDAQLEAPGGGVVKELRAEAGTVVKVGAVVAILDPA